ncbi:MAG: HlyC/CorC family transporter, partial [Clostridia bacterium]|nr:HlyC/CorC family transporter [Clostridia bacterium]
AALKDVAEELSLTLPEENTSTTFGGMIISELGSIPEDGSCPELVIDGFKILVNQVSDHRIGLTTVHRI